ncbi:MAG TPA: outer membrane protein assembly factor BamA [Longimicrobiaceae bacterium]|nr:outer membrane protein assembly factor BamA [Longimicrobiaceae bacterium]
MSQNSSRTRRVAVHAVLLGFVFLGADIRTAPAQQPTSPSPAATAQQGGAVLDSLIVRGNRRVAEGVIRTTSGLRPGAFVRPTEIQTAIRRLMATGNFESVDILSRGEGTSRVTLVVQVTERPLIAQVAIRGLESVGEKTVLDTVGIKENQPLNPSQVVRTQQMIRDLLAKEGLQVVSIDTTLTPMREPAGAFRLTFNVREGNRLAIADIEFQGNQAFPDEALRDAMKTKEEGFFWFRSGRFDRETFRTDLRERLPEFYGERGYIDFAVLSDTLVVDPQTGKARLVVNVSEGPQYRLGEFRIEGNSRFPTEQIQRLYTIERRSVLGLPFGGGGERSRGEVFNRAALDDATAELRRLYNNEGYLYAQVEPILRRVPSTAANEPATVNVTWAISERQPFYIRRVVIEGNTRTHESVIRERLLVLPGDVYNEERLIASYTSIGALGFFETPLPTPDILPNTEAGEVDIVFRVKEKQTGNINFGTSIGGSYAGRGGGVTGFLGFSEPNLFGQGKQGNLRVEYGYGRNAFEASYTDPAIFGSRNSGSISLFHTGDRYFSFGNVRRVRTGGAVQVGFPVPGLFRTRAFLGYSLARTAYFGPNDEECTAESTEVECLPNATASSLSLSLARDTKSHPLFPVSGTRQSVSLEQTGGPLGGDGNFQKASTEAEWWVPVGRLGGGQPGQRPIRMALGLTARAGTIFGDASLFPFEQYYAGGTRLPSQPLRGYKDASINALGFDETCGGSNFRLECLGNSFFSVSAEYAVRITDQLSVSAFADAGNVWRTAEQFNPTRLFRGAGIGGMVVTPFGPIGLDIAYGFDRPNPGWEVHFKFGQGF